MAFFRKLEKMRVLVEDIILASAIKIGEPACDRMGIIVEVDQYM